MTDGGLFYPQRRVKEMRSIIKNAADFEDEGHVHSAMLALLEDLAADLAHRAAADRDAAYHFIMRCMGAIAEANAADAYEPYGYVNPFAAAPPAKPVWKWPVITDPPAGGGGLRGAAFNPYSALKMFGYTVGKTEGWASARRQSFLTDFMTMTLPPIVVATFGNDYGKPMSTDRLCKIANIIASNATLRYRNDAARYHAAIADWEDDLAFLHRTFYIGKSLAFQPWPSSRPV